MTSNRTVAHQNALSQVFKRTEFTLGVIIIVLFVLAGTLTKNFTSAYNLTNLTKQGSIVGVMAVAQTVIIITGGIDISGGAVAGLSCMVMALLQTRTDTPFGLTVLACLAVAVLCGFCNGVIIFDLNVPAMIATLGTQTVIRGIVKLLCGGLNVTYTDARILNIGTGKLFGFIPYLALIWLCVAACVFIILRYTTFGRNLYVIGSGIEVARLSGIKVQSSAASIPSRACFMASPPLCWPPAWAWLNPGTGEGYDMSAIAAAGNRRRFACRRARSGNGHAAGHRADGAHHQCRHCVPDRPVYPGCNHGCIDYFRRGHGHDQNAQEGLTMGKRLSPGSAHPRAGARKRRFFPETTERKKPRGTLLRAA